MISISCQPDVNSGGGKLLWPRFQERHGFRRTTLNRKTQNLYPSSVIGAIPYIALEQVTGDAIVSMGRQSSNQVSIG
ncbi:hypothetical protein E2P81_ATG07336 [Venturia nashicola]|nr:hypothetical protein E2P81_ATG07336 [Venturia nashicola]